MLELPKVPVPWYSSDPDILIPAIVPEVAAPTALIVAVELSSTFGNPTSDLVVPDLISVAEISSTLAKPTSDLVVPDLMSAAEISFTLAKPTLALVVFAFNVFVASNVVDPICSAPLKPADPSAATKKFFDSILPLDKVILVPAVE